MLTADGVVSRQDMFARWRSRWDGVVPFKPRFRSWAGRGMETVRRGRAGVQGREIAVARSWSNSD